MVSFGNFDDRFWLTFIIRDPLRAGQWVAARTVIDRPTPKINALNLLKFFIIFTLLSAYWLYG